MKSSSKSGGGGIHIPSSLKALLDKGPTFSSNANSGRPMTLPEQYSVQNLGGSRARPDLSVPSNLVARSEQSEPKPDSDILALPPRLRGSSQQKQQQQQQQQLHPNMHMKMPQSAQCGHDSQQYYEGGGEDYGSREVNEWGDQERDMDAGGRAGGGAVAEWVRRSEGHFQQTSVSLSYESGNAEIVDDLGDYRYMTITGKPLPQDEYRGDMYRREDQHDGYGRVAGGPSHSVGMDRTSGQQKGSHSWGRDRYPGDRQNEVQDRVPAVSYRGDGLEHPAEQYYASQSWDGDEREMMPDPTADRRYAVHPGRQPGDYHQRAEWEPSESEYGGRGGGGGRELRPQQQPALPERTREMLSNERPLSKQFSEGGYQGEGYHVDRFKRQVSEQPTAVMPRTMDPDGFRRQESEPFRDAPDRPRPESLRRQSTEPLREGATGRPPVETFKRQGTEPFREAPFDRPPPVGPFPRQSTEPFRGTPSERRSVGAFPRQSTEPFREAAAERPPPMGTFPRQSTDPFREAAAERPPPMGTFPRQSTEPFRDASSDRPPPMGTFPRQSTEPFRDASSDRRAVGAFPRQVSEPFREAPSDRPPPTGPFPRQSTEPFRDASSARRAVGEFPRQSTEPFREAHPDRPPVEPLRRQGTEPFRDARSERLAAGTFSRQGTEPCREGPYSKAQQQQQQQQRQQMMGKPKPMAEEWSAEPREDDQWMAQRSNTWHPEHGKMAEWSERGGGKDLQRWKSEKGANWQQKGGGPDSRYQTGGRRQGPSPREPAAREELEFPVGKDAMKQQTASWINDRTRDAAGPERGHAIHHARTSSWQGESPRGPSWPEEGGAGWGGGRKQAHRAGSWDGVTQGVEESHMAVAQDSMPAHRGAAQTWGEDAIDLYPAPSVDDPVSRAVEQTGSDPRVVASDQPARGPRRSHSRSGSWQDPAEWQQQQQRQQQQERQPGKMEVGGGRYDDEQNEKDKFKLRVQSKLMALGLTDEQEGDPAVHVEDLYGSAEPPDQPIGQQLGRQVRLGEVAPDRRPESQWRSPERDDAPVAAGHGRLQVSAGHGASAGGKANIQPPPEKLHSPPEKGKKPLKSALKPSTTLRVVPPSEGGITLKNKLRSPSPSTFQRTPAEQQQQQQQQAERQALLLEERANSGDMAPRTLPPRSTAAPDQSRTSIQPSNVDLDQRAREQGQWKAPSRGPSPFRTNQRAEKEIHPRDAGQPSERGINRSFSDSVATSETRPAGQPPMTKSSSMSANGDAMPRRASSGGPIEGKNSGNGGHHQDNGRPGSGVKLPARASHSRSSSGGPWEDDDPRAQHDRDMGPPARDHHARTNGMPRQGSLTRSEGSEMQIRGFRRGPGPPEVPGPMGEPYGLEPSHHSRGGYSGEGSVRPHHSRSSSIETVSVSEDSRSSASSSSPSRPGWRESAEVAAPGQGGLPADSLPVLPRTGDGHKLVQCQWCPCKLLVPPTLQPSAQGIQKLRCAKCRNVSAFAVPVSSAAEGKRHVAPKEEPLRRGEPGPQLGPYNPNGPVRTGTPFAEPGPAYAMANGQRERALGEANQQGTRRGSEGMSGSRAGYDRREAY